jgi:threonine/homoserine/homoserine lactone efflux protein
VFSLLLRGFALGFAIAASPGPIFFLCVRRTLVRGPLYGLISGFGVATADGFYAALATFGVAALASALVSGRRPLALIGGAALAVLGLRILLERPQAPDAAPVTTAKSLAGAYLSTLGLTITNPATIISFAALAATLSLGAGGGFAKPALVVVGVLMGSAAWWCVLATAVSRLRARMTPAAVRGLSLFSGIAIIGLGVLAVTSAVAS